MNTKAPHYASHISFGRAVRGCPESEQEVLNRRAGATEHYSSKEVTGEWIVQQHPEPPAKGKGVAIYVKMLALLADAGAAQLGDMVAETIRGHSVIVESRTGRRTDNPKDRRIMLDFAVQSIRYKRRARVPEGFRTRGRRKAEFGDAEIEAGRKVWFAKRYVSDPAAAEDLPKGMTINHARRLYGSSGRAPGRKPKQKRKR